MIIPVKVYCFLSFILTFLLMSCSPNDKKSGSKYKNTEQYDLANPKILSLADLLNEISGVAYYPKDTSVFAIVDEMGLLFKIPLKAPEEFKYWEFSKTRDYEDVVFIDSMFYILVSKGDILTVDFSGPEMKTTKYDINLEGKNEFETMFVAPDSNGVVIVCKECDHDKKSTISSYRFTITDSGGVYSPYITFDMSRLKEERKEHFKAGAGNVHPLTGEIYLVTSVEKLLAIADTAGSVKQMIPLDPKLYKQPEGLTFTPEGNMIISNEFAEAGFAQLLLFKNKLEIK